MAFSGTVDAYKDTCASFLRILCNDKDMLQARAYLADACTLVHGDSEPIHGADAFIDMWSKNLVHMPEYHKVIVDIICELNDDRAVGATLWVYSRIRGIPGNPSVEWTDSVDMMSFNADGKFLYSKDVQRSVGRTDTDLEAKTTWGHAYVSNLCFLSSRPFSSNELLW